MSEERLAATPHHRTDERGAIADVDGNIGQCRMAIDNGDDIWNIEETGTARADAEPKRGGAQRVHDRKGLDRDAADVERASRRERVRSLIGTWHSACHVSTLA
jgi:hypothetical protein